MTLVAVRRFAIYLLAALAGSTLGSHFTRLSDDWANANPLTGSLAALYALGIPIVIAACARVQPKVEAAVATIAFVAMIAMWWLFTSNESSTSALVFLWGWLLGIPASVGLLVFADRTPVRRNLRRPPPPSM